MDAEDTMTRWTTIRKDLQKGLEQGMVAVKKGVMVVRDKAGEMTGEGRRQYRIYTLKTKIHREFSDLGARVFAVLKSGKRNPALDARVRSIVSRLKKLDERIATLEGKAVAQPRKRARKR